MAVTSESLKIGIVRCQDLRPDPKNPRKPIAGRQRAALRDSLSKFGMVQPVLHAGGLVIGGHQRLDVWWRDLGHAEIPGIDISGLTDVERTALNVALNKISSEWDNDKLSEVLREIQSADAALLGLAGFAERELSKFIGSGDSTKKMLADFATEPDPGKAWVVFQGTPAAVDAVRVAVEKAGIKVRAEAYTETKA